MKTPPFTNLAVFILFFGIALIEAIQQNNWLSAALFLALGALSPGRFLEEIAALFPCD